MATVAPNDDQSKTAIIVGASRGLGLGLAREFARRGWQVTATARNAAAANELADAVAASDGRIAVEEVDIDRAESIHALAAELAGRRFDLVFINAGVSGPEHQSVDAATPQELGALMYTNAVAPIRIARRLCRSSPMAARSLSCPRTWARSAAICRAAWTFTGQARPRSTRSPAASWRTM